MINNNGLKATLSFASLTLVRASQGVNNFPSCSVTEKQHVLAQYQGAFKQNVISSVGRNVNIEKPQQTANVVAANYVSHRCITQPYISIITILMRQCSA